MSSADSISEKLVSFEKEKQISKNKHLYEIVETNVKKLHLPADLWKCCVNEKNIVELTRAFQLFCGDSFELNLFFGNICKAVICGERQKFEAVLLLVKNQFLDLNAMRVNDSTFFHIIAQYAGNVLKPSDNQYVSVEDRLKCLMNLKLNINLASAHGWTALHCAIVESIEPEEMVAILLKLGADPILLTNDGLAPIHIASTFCSSQILIESLLNAGASVHHKIFEQTNVLHFGAQANIAPAIARFFIQKGVDVNSTNDDGFTALHYAVGYAEIGLIKFLIKAGAKVNALSNMRQTPLHFLLLREKQENLKEIFDLLVSAGADATLKDENGLHVLDFVEKLNIDRLPRTAQMH